MSGVRRWGMSATYRDGNNNMREVPRWRNDDDRPAGSDRNGIPTGRPRRDKTNSGQQQDGCPQRSNVSREEFTTLAGRVEKMEMSVNSIESSLDVLLAKVTAMETRERLVQNETLEELLGSITEAALSGNEVRKEEMKKLVKEELGHWDSGDSSHQPALRMMTD